MADKVSAREKCRIPEGLNEELTEKFMIASLIVTCATGLAVSKAFMNQYKLLKKAKTGGAAGEEPKIKLSHQDVDNLENGALSFMPDCIKHFSQYGVDPADVNRQAMEIFNGYGVEGQMDRMSDRLSKVLSNVCKMPEHEPKSEPELVI